MDIDGQTLTELLYDFDHRTSRLCHFVENDGLGLSMGMVLQLQKTVDAANRIHGFAHYSAVSPRTRRLTTHRTMQIMFQTAQDSYLPGILSPAKIGIYYQHIIPDILVRSLRAILNARHDISPPARGCILIFHHQEKGGGGHTT